MDIMIRTCAKGQVPALELWQPEKKRSPMVVAQHGYLGRKEFILPQAYLFASMGFFVLVPDAWRHGERALGTPLARPGRSAAGKDEPGLYPDLIDCALETALGMDELIALYDGDERADSGRAGLVGYSMGGMVCFSYLTLAHERVKALCPVIGSPDWASIVQAPDAAAHLGAMGVHAREELDALLARARRRSPSAITRVDPLPMLVQNGEADPLMEVAPIRDYLEAIRPRYRDPQALELRLYPGQGHCDTIEMNQRVAQWFTRYL